MPIGEVGIDHDLVARALHRSVLWRNKAETTQMLWRGERDRLVEAFKQDLIEMTEAFGHDLVPVFLLPPEGYSTSFPRQVGKEWEDSRGYRWRYSPGNDSYLLMHRPRREFAGVEDLEAFFAEELVGRFGFRIAAVRAGEYRLELDDPSRLELVRHAVKRFGNEKFIFARGFGYSNGNLQPLEFSEFEVIAEFFGGDEANLFMSVAEHPVLVRRAMELYSQVHMATTDVMADEGVDGIVSAGDFASEQGLMIAPDTIRDLFLPAMKQEVEHIHSRGLKAISHNCGNNWALLDMLLEAGYDCWQSIQRSAGMDLRLLKKRYGNDLAFWGGIEISSLHAPGSGPVEDDVRYAIQHAAPDGGLILGACSTVAYGCSYENYRIALSTARTCGRYPLQLSMRGEPL